MLTFEKNPHLKDEIERQLIRHYEADEIIKGKYWDMGKGCAVGCTIHSSDHMLYESLFGIPVMLARLEDCIFEGLSNELAKEWPLRFWRSIKPGLDMSFVGWKFLYWILDDEFAEFQEHKIIGNSLMLCKGVIHKKSMGNELPREQINAAANAAYATNAAAYVAAYAADAAADATDAAALAAANAANAANADYSAADAAKKEFYKRAADKLIYLIETT